VLDVGGSVAHSSRRGALKAAEYEGFKSQVATGCLVTLSYAFNIGGEGGVDFTEGAL